MLFITCVQFLCLFAIQMFNLRDSRVAFPKSVAINLNYERRCVARRARRCIRAGAPVKSDLI